MQGQWQQESPAREYLEQVKCCHDADCNESMMEKDFTALKNETWEEYKETFKEKMKASAWAFDRIKKRRSCSQHKDQHCARDHAQKYGLLAAYHLASWRSGRSHNVLPVPKLQQFPSGRLPFVYLCGKDHKV